MRLHLFLCLFLFATSVFGQDPSPKELDRYLALPDDSFHWEIVERTEKHNENTFLVDLTSQTWQGIPWKHSLLVVLPNKLVYPNHAVLYIGQQVGGTVALRVVPAESVKRNEDHIVRLLRGLGIGAVVGMNKRKGGVEILCGRKARPRRQSEKQRQNQPEPEPTVSKKHQIPPHQLTAIGLNLMVT